MFSIANLILAETPTAGSILGDNEKLFWNLTYLIIGLYLTFRTVQIVRYFRRKSNKPDEQDAKFAATVAQIKEEQKLKSPPAAPK